MEEILSGYKVGSATWLYLSFFLIVAIYFRFNRIVTLRNGDLFTLLTISPGILLAKTGSLQNAGGMVGIEWVGTPVRFAFLVNQTMNDTVLFAKEDQVVAALATYGS